MKLEGLTFRAGTHVEEYKSLSSGTEIVAIPAPDEVILTMSQHIGAPAKPIVQKGDQVKVGQMIAEAGGFVSAPVYASVSGEVTGIIDYLTSAGSKVKAVVIQNDKQNTLGYEEVDRSIEDLSAEDIVAYVKEAGIVGMGGAGFPTHVKLVPPKGMEVDSIIINGAECEPYLTCDDVTMRTMPEKVVEGLKLCMKASGAAKGYIAVEDNKPKAIELLEKASAKEENISIAVMKTKYPQGDEKRIIDSVLGRHVPAGALPAAVGVIVTNVSTACAIADACLKGIPLYQRVLTVTGHGVNEPKNLLVPFGTKIKDIVAAAGGYAGTTGKIIFGGPMMGVAQSSDENVTDKRNNGVLVFTEEEANLGPVSACIRCGRCVEACPVFLEPNYLSAAVLAEDWEASEKFFAHLCIECGTCSFVCPANRPLTESIRLGKSQVMAIQRNRK